MYFHRPKAAPQSTVFVTHHFLIQEKIESAKSAFSHSQQE